MARRPRLALESLRRISAETVDLFDRLANISDRATDRSSEVLVGVASGSSSLLLAYVVSLTLPAVSFALTGPIAACVGIPIGILAWRGRRRFRIERLTTENRLRIEAEIAENKLKSDEVLRRIRALPKNAPQETRDELYRGYKELTAALGQRSLPQPEGSSAPSALPPPSPPLALPPPLSFENDKIAEHVPRGDARKERGLKNKSDRDDLDKG